MTREITSRSNPLVRRVRALLAEADRREREGRFVVEGLRLCGEVLLQGLPVERALLDAKLVGKGDRRVAELLGRLEESGTPVSLLGRGALAACQDADAPQGAALVVPMPRPSLDEAVGRSGERIVVVAWQIQDPGNLGAILRVAEAAGARAAVCVRGGADPYHPRSVRASAGSILRIPVVARADPARLCTALRERGLVLTAALPRGGRPPDRTDLTGPLAVVVGNEGSGLPDGLDGEISLRVSVPMSGRVESLNVAVSTALVLFEARRQREGRRG